MTDTSVLAADMAEIRQALARVATLSDKIGAKIPVIAKEGHVPLIRFFADVSALWDEMNERKKKLNAVYDHMSQEAVPNAMREAGVKTITVEGVGRVTISHRFSCTMLDKEKGKEWLKANGHGDLIQETVNAQTLGAFAKNLIEDEGKELPIDVFKTGLAPYTSITKAK